MAIKTERKSVDQTVTADVLGSRVALDVAIVDGSGNQITTFGGSGGTSATDGDVFVADATLGTPMMAVASANPPDATSGDIGVVSMTLDRELRVSVTSGGTSGTQYTEADTDASITGNAIMWEDAADTLRAVSASKPLPTAPQSVIPGTGATNLGKAEDAAHSTGHTGVMALAVQKISPAALSDADGDYTPLIVDSNGRLYITLAAENVIATLLSEQVHDAADGNQGVQAMGYASAAAPTDVSADADAVRAWHLRNGAAATVITAAGALIGGDAGNGLDVDVTRVLPGTTNLALGKAEDALHSTGDAGVMILAVRESTPTDLSGGATDGDYEPLQVGATGRLWTASNVDQLAGTATAVNNGTASNGTLRVTVASDSTGNIATIGTSVTPGTSAAHLGKAEDGAHTTGDTGVMMLAVRQSTSTDLSAGATNGDYEPLQVDANGRLWGIVNQDQIAGTAVAVNNGTASAGTQRVTIASDSTGNIATIGTSVTPGTGASNLGKAEDAAHTTADVGVMALGVRAAAPTDRSAGPTDGDYEPFATNEVGAVWVSVTPSANGGASTLNSTSSDGGTALTNSAQAIKASAGTLKGYYIYNPNASAQFVQFYNTASGSVTVGTTNPLFMLTIPATSAANLWMTDGIAFSTAISWSATSTAGGNGAPGSSLDAVAWYK